MMTPNIGKQHLRAVLASRSQRAHLLQAEIDWPGSRALLERFAAGLGACYATDTLLRDRLNLIVAGAILGYRAAKQARKPDRERFWGFIAGIAAVLESREHAALALALTPGQRRILGGRLSVVPRRAHVRPGPADA
jgi:hypothetical protein